MEDNKIILIKGSDSVWYDQAIFVLKKNESPKKIPINLVYEAEKIINEYMNKNTFKIKSPVKEIKPTRSTPSVSSNTTNKKRKYDYAGLVLNIGLIMSCVLLAMVLYNFLF